MAKKKKKLTKGQFRRLQIAIGIVVVLVSLSLAMSFFANIAYSQKMYPQVQVAGIDLGGKTQDEAKKILSEKASEYINSKPSFKLTYEEQSWSANLTALGEEINVDQTVEAAFKIGHEENFLMSAVRQIQGWFSPIKVDLNLTYNGNDFNYFMKPIKVKLETPYQNDSYKFDGLDVVEVSAKEGKGIDEGAIKQALLNYANQWRSGTIKIDVRTTYPKVLRDNTLEAKAEAERMVAYAITLINQRKEYPVTKSRIASWIKFTEEQTDNADVDPFGASVAYHFKLKAQLSDSLVEKYVNGLSEDINTLPENARLHFVNGKLRILSKSRPGTILDEKSLVSDIENIVNVDGEREIEIKVNVLSSEINEENLSKLGIKELISTGVSDFSGSPSNRRHNIAVGASIFNGVIVKPDEEFSFTTTLGEVSAKTGYLPELVIKEDKTIPEYGGGLCQVSTTAFRAAVLAGLPITERKPHSYRVKYYDWPYGPGFDSTVYIPHPDMRFVNDTGHYILIQTYISGNRLYFEFYGTKGKRTTKIVGPKVLWSAKSGAMKTEFYQYVYEAGKLIRKTRFYSFYDDPAKYHTNTTTTTTTKPKTTTTNSFLRASTFKRTNGSVFDGLKLARQSGYSIEIPSTLSCFASLYFSLNSESNSF